MKQQSELQAELRTQMIDLQKDESRWQDIEWLTEPILHVMPDTDVVPLALVGIVAVMHLDSDATDGSAPHVLAGTAVFYFEEDKWCSKGKVLLNLTPAEAFGHLCHKAMSL